MASTAHVVIFDMSRVIEKNIILTIRDYRITLNNKTRAYAFPFLMSIE